MSLELVSPIIELVSEPLDDIIDNNLVKKIILTGLPRTETKGMLQYGHQKQIRLYILNNLIKKIKQADGQFVSPIVFVDFIKRILSTNDHITLSQNLLFKVKLWSNQLRQEAQKEKPNDKLIEYIGYVIACELLDEVMPKTKT